MSPICSQPITFCPDYFFCFHSLLLLPLPCPTTFTKVRVIFSKIYMIISFPCLKLFNRLPSSFGEHGLQRLHVVLFIPLSGECHIPRTCQTPLTWQPLLFFQHKLLPPPSCTILMANSYSPFRFLHKCHF